MFGRIIIWMDLTSLLLFLSCDAEREVSHTPSCVVPGQGKAVAVRVADR